MAINSGVDGRGGLACSTCASRVDAADDADAFFYLLSLFLFTIGVYLFIYLFIDLLDVRRLNSQLHVFSKSSSLLYNFFIHLFIDSLGVAVKLLSIF